MSADVKQPSTRAADVLRILVLALTAALIATVFLWQLRNGFSIGRWVLAGVLTLPLWAPLPGLIRGTRRTYAWATLCVIPSFILGITETIASPATRQWSGTCLAAALLLFATLIGYLRTTRGS